MPYCITLRSRTDRKVIGWYDGSDSRWSTDHNRQKIFPEEREVKQVRDELRKLCPRNANLINAEPTNFPPRAPDSDFNQFRDRIRTATTKSKRPRRTITLPA
jgi:hypothetical protein